jgi:hypothetical protein
MIVATSVDKGSATASGNPGSKCAVSSRRYDSRSPASMRSRALSAGAEVVEELGRHRWYGRRGAARLRGVSESTPSPDAAAMTSARRVDGAGDRRPVRGLVPASGARLLVPEEGSPIGLTGEPERRRAGSEALGLVMQHAGHDRSLPRATSCGDGARLPRRDRAVARPPEMAAETLDALTAARVEGRPTTCSPASTASVAADRHRGRCARERAARLLMGG